MAPVQLHKGKYPADHHKKTHLQAEGQTQISQTIVRKQTFFKRVTIFLQRAVSISQGDEIH